MGGPTRDKIKLIATVNASPLEETIKNVQKLIETGFKAVRITPFPKGFQNLSHSDLIIEAVKQVKAIREMVGDEIDVAVECLTRLRPYEAVTLGKELEKYRILFYEDPVLWENVVTLAEIQRNITIPVATGERLYSLYQYQDLLINKASQIIRPDVLIAGGLSNLRKIAALAQANYVEMVPHNPSNRFGFLCATNAHLCASVNNVIALEYANGIDFGNEDPSKAEIAEPLEIKDGYLMLPKKPGIGVSLNEKNIGEGIPSS
jgi:galactonate dehydratase